MQYNADNSKWTMGGEDVQWFPPGDWNNVPRFGSSSLCASLSPTAQETNCFEKHNYMCYIDLTHYNISQGKFENSVQIARVFYSK